jgi:L-aspartate oxidase
MADLDLLVLGSGVAGLSAAVRASTSGLRVGVLTKGELEQSATRWAQGGVAAVLADDEDSTDLHLADTLAAGAGLCDVDAVRILVDEGPTRVTELIALGAVFDLDEDGQLQLAREGGHSRARVVHAGGAATGMEIERALVEATQTTAASVMERWLAVDLIMENGHCRGVLARRPDGERVEVRATHTLLATGGAGQLFAVTTNPEQATGDGIAMALRAGIAIADVEFMQFHPTALHHPAMPRPLLSEALRGHGAILRDKDGNQFVDELSSRDVVSRAMQAKMIEQGVDHLWLDATGLERFAERFPTITASLTAVGLDAAKDWLPIAPAAHYLSGGVVTDLDGRAAVEGLWAAGEAACAGVHGANRLASNSLLDGMVFAARVVEAIEDDRVTPQATGAMRAVLDGDGGIPGRRIDRPETARAVAPAALGPDKIRDALQRAMTLGAGVLRSAESLEETDKELLSLQAAIPSYLREDELELNNLFTVAYALLDAATAREESRGAHTRTDFPDTSPDFRCRLVIQ